MRLYGLKNCDTCRKAAKSLTAGGHEVEFVDVRTDGISADLLTEFLKIFGTALVNSRSTTWRGLTEDERRYPPLKLLQKHPALMKRPVIQAGTQMFLGWDKQVQKTLLGDAL